jgi:hypothetical protein
MGAQQVQKVAVQSIHWRTVQDETGDTPLKILADQPVFNAHKRAPNCCFETKGARLTSQAYAHGYLCAILTPRLFESTRLLPRLSDIYTVLRKGGSNCL